MLRFIDQRTQMNAFDEFIHVARLLKEANIPYAVVGGVALAFHGHPRFTQDIDLIVMGENIPNLTKTLGFIGYKSFTTSWKLAGSDFTLHRFLKHSSENEMILDILEGSTGRISDIIGRSLTAVGDQGDIRVACKEDLIQLKRLRNSLQDQADIEKLSNEKS